MKIMITGAHGQLGRSIVRIFEKSDCELLPFGKLELDITDNKSIFSVIERHRPRYLIHCAAMTDVDLCEKEVDKAFRINSDGVRNIAVASQKNKCVPVYISTDFVFSGEGKKPWSEGDPVGPKSVYAMSKLLGEYHIKAHNERFLIVRTAWLYGLGGNSFPAKIRKLAIKNKRLEVVDDQIGNPTFTDDLAERVLSLVKGGHFGIFHGVNRGYCSRYDQAKFIIEKCGIEASIKRISSKSIKGARRPLFSALADDRAKKEGISPMPFWQDALYRFIVLEGWVKGQEPDKVGHFRL